MDDLDRLIKKESKRSPEFKFCYEYRVNNPDATDEEVDMAWEIFNQKKI